MRFLCFQRQRSPTGGAAYVSPVIKTKARQFGPVEHVECVPRKRCLLITGAHDSGKSRWLNRLHAESAGVWKKAGGESLSLSALRPLGAWCEQPHVAAWYARQRLNDVAEARPARPEWSKLKAWERVEQLPEYLRETGAVLFLDDCHKLSGRKLQIARECVLACKLYCAAATDEQRIPPNLRAVLLRRDPHTIRLNTEVAYDASNVFMWVLALLLCATGAYEAGAAMAGLRLLAGGRRAARQD